MADREFTVAILGAGPAGLYAAKKLAKSGVKVVVINRDVRPGGLAEYGIFHDKYAMKRGLRKVFDRILSDDNVTYRGHVSIGEKESVNLGDIEALGFDAVLVAVGAQGIKWIDVEGSEAGCIYDAKQVVYHYNGLPPYASQEVTLGDHLVIIGAGNVAVDITHWAVQQKVPRITWLVRRGPSQVKYTPKEMRYVGGHVDLDALAQEFRRITPQLEAVGEQPADVWQGMTGDFGDKRIEGSDSRIAMHFAVQARRVNVNDAGNFASVEVTENELYASGGRVRCRQTDGSFSIDADSLVFCIGDTVETAFGLALDKWGDYAMAPSSDPGDPDAASYALQDREGWFAAGWARVASDGLVGKARSDAERGCEAILTYLEGKTPKQEAGAALASLDSLLAERGVVAVDNEHFQKVRAVEVARAEKDGLSDFRFVRDEDMLREAGLR